MAIRPPTPDHEFTPDVKKFIANGSPASAKKNLRPLKPTNINWKKVIFRFPQELLEKIDERVAKTPALSRNQWLMKIIKDHLKNNKD